MKPLIPSIFLLLLFISPIKPQNTLFSNGQEADLLLGLHSSITTPTGLNHPARAKSDGQRLFVADTRNHRILIWNSIPTKNNEPPDIVVGQKNFTSNFSGNDRYSLNWPIDVFSDGVRLFVADTYNNRVLIWNTIPKSNGAPADIVLGQPEFENRPDINIDDASKIIWPWAVHFDGTKLYVASTTFGKIMIWNTLPDQNNKPADIVVGQKDFISYDASVPNNFNLATPRSIAVDNGKLFVEDYNFHRVLIWNSIPTQNGQPADIVIGQDSFSSNTFNGFVSHCGMHAKDGKLFISDGRKIYYWDKIPTVNNQSPDIIFNGGESKFYGTWGVFYDGDRLFVADQEADRILIYNQLPQNESANPDLIIGQNDFNTVEQFDRKGILSCAGVASNGTQLAISSGWRLLLYNKLPEIDEPPADNLIASVDWGKYDVVDPNMYSSFRGATKLWTDGIKFANADQVVGIQIWNHFPQEDKKVPDIIIPRINNYTSFNFSGPDAVTLYKNKIFINDPGNKRILIWHDYHKANIEIPNIYLSTEPYTPTSIATDGKRLIIGCIFGTTPGAIMIWNSIPESNNVSPDIILTGHPLKFNGVTGVFLFENTLFLSDIGNHRVCIYNNFPQNSTTPYDIVLGQKDLLSDSPGKSRTKMTNPNGIWFDGEYLWVGEFKFADRVLRFKANIEPVAPKKPTNLTGNAINNHTIVLNWNDNANNERGYVLKYKRDSSLDYEIYGYLCANSNSIEIENLSSNSSYSFFIYCYNSYGTSLNSDTISVVTGNLINRPPEIPFNPTPTNGGLIENYTNLYLGWHCYDQDQGDLLKYDVYFSNYSNPPLIIKNLEKNFFSDALFSLPENTTFYWKVVAHDLQGDSSISPIWSGFTPGHHSSVTRVNLFINSDTGGSTIPLPGHYSYIKNLSTKVYAIPHEGFIFSKWIDQNGVIVSENNPYSVLFDSEKNLKAVFINKNTNIDWHHESNLPTKFKLFNCFPNPFNPTTTISFSVPISQLVTLKVYDVLGREITTLLNEFKQPGNYKIQFNGQNLSSGIYYYQLKAGQFIDTKKFILLK